MRKLRFLMVVPAGLIGLLVTAPPAGATHRVSGTYTMVITWTSAGLPPADFTLTVVHRHHTCSVTPWVLPTGNTCTWATTPGVFTMTLSNPALPTATYIGKITPTGFNSPADQGTATTSAGASGTWYATRS